MSFMEGRKYRVNPFCPNCGEEHAYWTIAITEEEQKIVDKYYEDNKFKSTLEMVFAEIKNPPLVVEKEFQCPVCRTVFIKRVPIYLTDNVNFRSKDIIPMGVHPVF